MEDSILTSTKRVLGLAEDYEVFDFDVINHINASFAILSQLGIGPSEGFFIEDDATEWSEYTSTGNVLSMVRTYVFLKCRMLFDPPTTSYLIDATNNQIKELEWRLNVLREGDQAWMTTTS